MLTPKQEAFCLSYLETGNASEAYRRAYDASRMKPESVNQLACRMLAKVKIRSRVEELQAEAARRNEVEVDEVVQGLANIMRTDLLDIISWKRAEAGHYVIEVKDYDSLTQAQRAAIKKLKTRTRVEGRGSDRRVVEYVEVELHDKIAAIDRLGKHLGMFDKDAGEKVEVRFNLNMGDGSGNGDD